MRVRHILLLLAVSAAAYLLLWPTGARFEAFAPPEAPELTGALAPDDALDDLPTLGTVGEGPEDIAIDADGKLYTGLADGHVMTFAPGDKVWRALLVTYGRPLGLAFDASGRWLYIADAEKGLMRSDKAGHLERLVDTFAGRDLGLVDDLAVAGDTAVYFTAASDEYGWADYADALLTHSGTGRLYRYDVPARRLELLADSLQFANGVAVSHDGRAVFVAETGNYRVLRYDLASGEVTVFADNLPGFPDGLNYDARGRLWVSIASPRSSLLDAAAPYPFAREVIYRAPPGLQPRLRRYALAVALDREGEAVASLHGPKGRYAAVTNFVWRGDTAYAGSLVEREVGVYVADGSE